ncbi:hypothetical protein TKK_0010961 [Trichogramma kaykai]|uniref:Methyltransferase domain-containing protein n=1 Tax=Trichogramma kaykai TaxID=54128 RepID=A0ABD2WUY5_9HYME
MPWTEAEKKLMIEIRSLTSKSLVNPEYEEITDSSISEISSDIGGQTEQHHKSDDSTRGGSSCERDYHDCSIVVVTSKNKDKSKGSNVTDDSCVDMSISPTSSNANQLYYDADDEHTAFGDNETFCAYDNFDILPNIVAGYDESSCTFDQNPVSKNYLIQSYDPRFYEDPDIFGPSGNNDHQSFNPDYDEPAKRYLLNSYDSRFCCDDPNTSTFNVCEHSSFPIDADCFDIKPNIDFHSDDYDNVYTSRIALDVYDQMKKSKADEQNLFKRRKDFAVSSNSYYNKETDKFLSNCQEKADDSFDLNKNHNNADASYMSNTDVHNIYFTENSDDTKNDCNNVNSNFFSHNFHENNCSEKNFSHNSLNKFNRRSSNDFKHSCINMLSSNTSTQQNDFLKIKVEPADDDCNDRLSFNEKYCTNSYSNHHLTNDCIEKLESVTENCNFEKFQYLKFTYIHSEEMNYFKEGSLDSRSNFNNRSMLDKNSTHSDGSYDSDYDEEINNMLDSLVPEDEDGVTDTLDNKENNILEEETIDDNLDLRINKIEDVNSADNNSELTGNPDWYEKILQDKIKEAKRRLECVSNHACCVDNISRAYILRMEQDHNAPLCQMDIPRHIPLNLPWNNFWKFTCEVGCKYRKDPPPEHAHVNCEELMMVHSETDTVINSKSSANCEFPDFIIETVNMFQEFAYKTTRDPNFEITDEVYDTFYEKPIWTYITIRSNYSNEIQLTVCGKGVSGLIKPLKKYFTTGSGKACNVTSLYYINQKRSLKKGGNSIPLYLTGTLQLIDKVGNLELIYNPKSWKSFNSKQTELMGNFLCNYLDPNPEITVLEIGCGIGVLSLILSQRAKEVIGLNLSEDELAIAEEIKNHNAIRNVEFVQSGPKEIYDKCCSKLSKSLSVAIINLNSIYGKYPSTIAVLRDLPSIGRAIIYGPYTQEHAKYFSMLTSPGRKYKDEFLPRKSCIIDKSPSKVDAFNIAILFERHSLVDAITGEFRTDIDKTLWSARDEAHNKGRNRIFNSSFEDTSKGTAEVKRVKPKNWLPIKKLDADVPLRKKDLKRLYDFYSPISSKVAEERQEEREQIIKLENERMEALKSLRINSVSSDCSETSVKIKSEPSDSSSSKSPRYGPLQLTKEQMEDPNYNPFRISKPHDYSKLERIPATSSYAVKLVNNRKIKRIAYDSPLLPMETDDDSTSSSSKQGSNTDSSKQSNKQQFKLIWPEIVSLPPCKWDTPSPSSKRNSTSSKKSNERWDTPSPPPKEKDDCWNSSSKSSSLFYTQNVPFFKPMTYNEYDSSRKSSSLSPSRDFLARKTSSSYHRSSLSSPRRRSPEHRYSVRDRWNSPSPRRRSSYRATTPTRIKREISSPRRNSSYRLSTPTRIKREISSPSTPTRGRREISTPRRHSKRLSSTPTRDGWNTPSPRRESLYRSPTPEQFLSRSVPSIVDKAIALMNRENKTSSLKAKSKLEKREKQEKREEEQEKQEKQEKQDKQDKQDKQEKREKREQEKQLKKVKKLKQKEKTDEREDGEISDSENEEPGEHVEQLETMNITNDDEIEILPLPPKKEIKCEVLTDSDDEAVQTIKYIAKPVSIKKEPGTDSESLKNKTDELDLQHMKTPVITPAALNLQESSKKITDFTNTEGFQFQIHSDHSYLEMLSTKGKMDLNTKVVDNQLASKNVAVKKRNVKDKDEIHTSKKRIGVDGDLRYLIEKKKILQKQLKHEMKLKQNIRTKSRSISPPSPSRMNDRSRRTFKRSPSTRRRSPTPKEEIIRNRKRSVSPRPTLAFAENEGVTLPCPEIQAFSFTDTKKSTFAFWFSGTHDKNTLPK